MTILVKEVFLKGEYFANMEGASAEQNNVLQQLQRTHVVVDSVAGSGKTFTALHIAKSFPKRNHLLITYNAKLKIDTRKRVKTLGVTNMVVHTYHSYAFAKDDFELVEHLNQGVMFETKFDTILVDEVQDMKPVFFRLLTHIVQHHTLAGVRLVLFGDRNQCIYRFMKADARYLTLAPKLWEKRLSEGWVRTALTQSYRITAPMGKFVNDCMFGFNKMVAPKASALKPEYLVVNPWSERGVLYYKMRELLTRYRPEDIYVLSYSLKSKIMRRLENHIKMDFPAVNTYAQTSEDTVLNESVLKNKLAFCTFHSSKGTERKVVIVLGFDSTYFDHYARTDDRERCPNLLYVAATRATDHLILVQGAAPLPFLKRQHLPQCCTVVTEEEDTHYCERCDSHHFNPCRDVVAGTKPSGTRSVTDLLRHLDPDTIDRCFRMLQVTRVQEGGAFNMMPPALRYTAPPYENCTMEEVSDITGTAIPAFYEMRKSGRCTLVDCLSDRLVRHPQVLVDIKKGRYTLSHAMAPEPQTAEQFLFTANLWLAAESGYVGRLTQLRAYDWFDDPAMEQCMERVDDTMLRIGMVPTEYERNLDVNPRPETHGFALTGRADMLDATHMVELKATTELRREHYLQVALYMYMMQVNGCPKPHNYLYNVLSDELVEIRCDCLVELVDDLISAKLAMQKDMTDEEFLARH